MDEILGHTSIDADGNSRTEDLKDHLALTEHFSRQFAVDFGCEEIAGIVARFHDVGKASAAFQAYIRKSIGDSEENRGGMRGPDHSSAGAQFLASKEPGVGALLSYAIAGHHAGLPDGNGGESSLYSRLRKNIPEWKSVLRKVLPDADSFEFPREKIAKSLIPFFSKRNGFSISFFIRMVFSCLVDADFLATEKFMDSEKSSLRIEKSLPTFPDLESRLNDHLKKFGNSKSVIGEIRNEVRAYCLDAAALPPGVFRLTVPTGGGKTLSSLAFALRHARKHGLKRVVYVMPFTSIIEQNAGVFRDAIGEENVIEHHCNVDIDEDGNPVSTRAKLAAENWDAPVIVTTGVQFYESLFSHKPSRCRKLHNLAKSVIILDEAQTIPADFLKPCLRALDELATSYGVTIVLCTATQPAIDSAQFPSGLRGNEYGIRDIVPASRNLHERLRRVTVSILPEPLSPDSLCEKMSEERQALMIVNTRGQAREIFEKLSTNPTLEKDSLFHLSAQMCPAHRNAVVAMIKNRLACGEACRVISTQLIEAGVDIDFPCVFRAMSGIDSIAQAAGRCNREGKLGGNGGRVFVFIPESRPPAGFLRNTADCGQEVLACEEFRQDPLSPETVTEYFRLLYWLREAELDKLNVLRDLTQFQGTPFTFKFRTLGENFKLIDDCAQAPVIIPYGTEGRALCERLRSTENPKELRKLSRKLQRYSVSISRKLFDVAVQKGQIRIVRERYALLESPEFHYSESFGVDFSLPQELSNFSCVI